MKKKTLALATAFALGTGLSMSVTSVTANEDQVWFGGFAEYYDADKDKFNFPVDDESGLGAGLELGTRFSESWGGRIEVARINLDSFPGQAQIDGTRIGFDALYFPWQSNTYLFAGLKEEKLDRRYGLANLGVGHHWALNDKWRIITELAAYHDFGQSHKDYSAKLGVAYLFGGSSYGASTPADSDNDGVPNSKDACPNTPRGQAVDARGCALQADTPNNAQADSDKDGILDAHDECPNTPMTDKVDSKGCSMFTESQESVNMAVLFANDSSEIRNPRHEDIVRFADFMKRYPDLHAEIEGHTSAPGDASYNQGLSERRANAVRQLLISDYGISAARLQAVGYGETRLLDKANTAAAHAKNRRISASLVATKKVKVHR
ncbi:OmpA family protein [Alteromonas sp. a30]|uniref:OmpA family protein n=1 Tax=Alteromonas sp. a30 TaxID=2730917 RepID=UPI002282F5E2|nr:OmpA family protein [Alteromonas sp. a30]MCY7297081.1 OmpA family protein [Alteromonas sp. a30]